MDLSLILSAVAVAATLGLGIWQLILQRRVTAIEQDRRRDEITSRLVADVEASFEYGGSKEHRFVLRNRGPSRAEQVSFEVLPPESLDGLRLYTEGHRFPLDLDAHQEYRIACGATFGCAPTVDVVLRWTDGTGPREKRLTLPVSG